MADNHEENPLVDEDLAKAKKSMGSRVDPDESPEEAPKADENNVPEAPQGPQDVEDSKAGADNEDDKIVTPKEGNEPKDEPENKMPRAYIPLGKYNDEKKAWKQTEAELAEARQRIAELESIGDKSEGKSKDDDIEAFMEQTGFDRETVEGFLSLAEKRSLTPERVQALEKIQAITLETEIQEQFATEFKDYGEPELKNLYPEATAEQMKEAKKLLDVVAHTKEYHDKEMSYVIFKHKDSIAKIFTPGSQEPADQTPTSKRSMESSRIGNGKNTVLTAQDFADKKDFSELDTVDPALRSQIIKDMPTATYENWKAYHANKEKNGGVEVTRGGRKITLN